jgi:hypothetical protein
VYKIIYNNKIIDVVESPQFIKILSTGHVVLTNKSCANGLKGSRGNIYSFEPTSAKDVKVVSIKKITNEEFSRLQSLLNSEIDVIANTAYLATCRQTAIANLSKVCQQKIVEGFSIKLSDNKLYHFDLTTEDQLNLLNIENQLYAGVQNILYHATGIPCKMFNRIDLFKIVEAFRKHVLYHTTYFNVVKQYINTLTDTDKIEQFTYGEDVSSIVKDHDIKQILRRGGKI